MKYLIKLDDGFNDTPSYLISSNKKFIGHEADFKRIISSKSRKFHLRRARILILLRKQQDSDISEFDKGLGVSLYEDVINTQV